MDHSAASQAMTIAELEAGRQWVCSRPEQEAVGYLADGVMDCINHPPPYPGIYPLHALIGIKMVICEGPQSFFEAQLEKYMAVASAMLNLAMASGEGMSAPPAA